MIELPQLTLASASPRRAEILCAVGWPFIIMPADVDESEVPGERPDDYVMRLALAKAAMIAEKRPQSLVLGADTTVVIDDTIIGKPGDLNEARDMLRQLSGRWHEVLTGVAVQSVEGIASAVVKTRVKFRGLDENSIEYLVTEGSPLDKAGAYAVQAQAALFIEGIEGDYWNVVGLPIGTVYHLVAG